MKKTKLLKVFVSLILCTLMITFGANIVYAESIIEVGERKTTHVSFSSEVSEVEWRVEDSSIIKIVSTGTSGITIGSYFRGTHSAIIKGLKEGKTKVKVYAKNGGLIAEGTIQVVRIITPLSSCTIEEVGQQQYTGNAIEPKISIVDDEGNRLEEGIDYDVTYKNNISLGTATVTITGKGVYLGTAIKSFEIVTEIENCSVEEIKQQNYTGNTIEPEIIVMNREGIRLKKGLDYDVTYENNIAIGTATVTITGKGNYLGTITKDFEIISKSWFMNNAYTIKDGQGQPTRFSFNAGVTPQAIFSKLEIVKGYTAHIYQEELLQNDKRVGTGAFLRISDVHGRWEDYGIVIYGDVTGDGYVNSADALAIIKYKLGKLELITDNYIEAGRVTKTSREKKLEPNASDALAIIKAKLGKYTISL